MMKTSSSRPLLCIAVGLGLLATPSAAGAAPALFVSPQQKTPDASPLTQISLQGPPLRQIRGVTVKGSRSGRHAGKLRPYSGDRGASFIPDHRFTEGELVTVRIARAGAKTTTVSFTIARVGHLVLKPLIKRKPGAPKFNAAQTQAFLSRPDLHPPKIAASTPAAQTDGADIFIAPITAPPVNPKIKVTPIGPAGPMIVDARGQMIWFAPRPPGQAALDFRPQTLNGQPVLTWWQGTIVPPGFGAGVGYILDRSYKRIAVVRAGNGYASDLHEFALLPNGDALVTVYAPIARNLSKVGGSAHGVVLDTIAQEIDIKTGLVVYEWHTDGRVSVHDSYTAPPSSGPWDPWHLNSIEQLANGNLLVSERDTWGVYEIDRASGHVILRLGGKRSGYKLGPGARFAWQHDAHLQGRGLISLFDDEAAPPVGKRSRGLLLRLNDRRHTATVVHQYVRPGKTLAGSQGNMQVLPNGNVFVGFGAEPFFSEFSAAGRLLFDGSLPRGDDSYRAYRAGWTGSPTEPPVIAAQRTAAGINVYASQNGATEVASWQVIAGPDPGALAPVAQAPRSGFETPIAARTGAPYVAARALSASGQVLGTSAVAKP